MKHCSLLIFIVFINDGGLGRVLRVIKDLELVPLKCRILLKHILSVSLHHIVDLLSPAFAKTTKKY